MPFSRLAAIGIIAVVALSGSFVLHAAEPVNPSTANPLKNEFLRLVRDSHDRPIGLETAIVRYKSAAGTKSPVIVDLVAAVHIAEKSYYKQLDHEFENYDVVLYELVAPEGTKIPKGGRTGSDNPVSMLQNGLKDLLELDFQLNEIDYTRKNFVHADLTPDQFSQSMKDRHEGVSDIFMRMIAYAIAKQGDTSGTPSDADLLMAIFSKNRALAMKRVMAEQFQEMDGMLDVLAGPDGSTLISQRNKRALEVLKKQMLAGKKKIAIFYGAGHMKDLGKRLTDDFAMSPTETRWISAWDMRDRPAKTIGK